MKISVIVPIYNVESYLKECINTVINQSFRNFEIILIDDGSTDNSGKICEQFKREYSGLVVHLHQKNKGELAARMVGINMAQGDLLVFLDSDDSLREDALEVIHRNFCKYNCDMIFFDAGLCKNYDSKVVCHFIDDGVVYDEKAKENLYKNLITYKIPNSICLKAIRRERVHIPKRYENYYNLKNAGDLLMSAYFISKCKRFLYIKQELYHYRTRPGSAVNTFNINRKESIKIVHTEIEKQIEELGLLNLKSLHNCRKVKGWIDCVILLLKNLKIVGKQDFFRQIKSMAEDRYFIKAYQEMDCNGLSVKHRIFAFCLHKKQYFLLYLVSKIIQYKSFNK